MSIYLRGNTWHLYLARNGKRVRASLHTSDYEEANLRASAMEAAAFPAPKEWVFTDPWTNKRLWAMRDRSKGKPDICMTRDELKALAARSGGKCELTGIAFSEDRPRGCSRAPFAPSVDRIDHRRGYSFDNCRIVCFAVNVAMNQWGEAITRRFAMGLIAREGTICATVNPQVIDVSHGTS